MLKIEECGCPFCTLGTDVAYLTDCCGTWQDVENVTVTVTPDDVIRVCSEGRGCLS